MYLWNIYQWVENELPVEVRRPTMAKWMQALLKPLKELHSYFETYRLATLKKMRYNGQVIVLENVLNDLYDPLLRRFRISTTYDVLNPLYVYRQNETSNTNPAPYLRTEQAYVQDTAHVLTRIYLHTTNELGVLYDFIVLAPDSFIAVSDITKMKATVNLHRLAGKKPKYQYINSLQQF